MSIILVWEILKFLIFHNIFRDYEQMSLVKAVWAGLKKKNQNFLICCKYVLYLYNFEV